jgi:hypothetical protein
LTSSANGAFGQQERQDRAGISPVNGRPALGGLLFGRAAALILHLAAIETHEQIVAEWALLSMSALPSKAAVAVAWRRVR